MYILYVGIVLDMTICINFFHTINKKIKKYYYIYLCLDVILIKKAMKKIMQ